MRNVFHATTLKFVCEMRATSAQSCHAVLHARFRKISDVATIAYDNNKYCEVISRLSGTTLVCAADSQTINLANTFNLTLEFRSLQVQILCNGK